MVNRKGNQCCLMKKKIMERIIDEMAAEQAKEQEQPNGKEKKIKEENKRRK